jgi:hypothetical protein
MFIEMLVRLLCIAFPTFETLEQLKDLDAEEGNGETSKVR